MQSVESSRPYFKRDLTSTFREITRKKRRNLGLAFNEDSILRKKRKKSKFAEVADEIATSLEQIRTEIRQKRDEYLDRHKHQIVRTNRMTDADREQFQAELTTRVKLAGSKLNKLKSNLNKMKNTGPNFMTHCGSVINILDRDTKRVYKMIQSLLQERQKHLQSRQEKYGMKIRAERVKALNFRDGFAMDIEVTDADRAILERENRALAQAFEEQQDHTKQIERQTREVVEKSAQIVQHLQDQEVTVKTIDDNIRDALENQKQGNLYLRYVEESQVSSRFAILSMIGILTFSLLFLDFWNP